MTFITKKQFIKYILYFNIIIVFAIGLYVFVDERLFTLNRSNGIPTFLYCLKVIIPMIVVSNTSISLGILHLINKK